MIQEIIVYIIIFCTFSLAMRSIFIKKPKSKCGNCSGCGCDVKNNCLK